MARSVCLICSRDFYVKPSHQSRGWGKYCSIKCRTFSQFKGKEVLCDTCGKKAYKSQTDLRKSKSGKHFCSKSCQTIWRNTTVYVGEDHANWKTGIAASRRLLALSGKMRVCTLCKNNDTRVLIVHHLDHNRSNNKGNNLIWLCCNCHFLIHHHKKEESKLKTIYKQLEDSYN